MRVNDFDLLNDNEFQNLSLELKTKLFHHYPLLILKLKETPNNDLIMLALNEDLDILLEINLDWIVNNEVLVKDIIQIKKNINIAYHHNFFSIFYKKSFSQEIQDLLFSKQDSVFLKYHFIQKSNKYLSQETLLEILKINVDLFEGMDNANFKTSEYAILTNPSNIIHLSTNNVLTPVEKIKLYIMGLKKDPKVLESVSIVDSTNAHDAILKLENKLCLIQLMNGKTDE